MQKHSEIKAEIRNMDEQFAAQFAAHDEAAMSQLYTDEAVIVAPGTKLVEGRDAIQKFWKDIFSSGIKNTRLEPLSVERHGDLTLEVGSYTMIGDDDKTLDEGQYLVAWKYEAGQWRIHRDAWSSTLTVH